LLQPLASGEAEFERAEIERRTGDRTAAM
jgi:hypothetical protein